jgi:hypothetical protein
MASAYLNPWVHGLLALSRDQAAMAIAKYWKPFAEGQHRQALPT